MISADSIVSIVTVMQISSFKKFAILQATTGILACSSPYFFDTESGIRFASLIYCPSSLIRKIYWLKSADSITSAIRNELVYDVSRSLPVGSFQAAIFLARYRLF